MIAAYTQGDIDENMKTEVTGCCALHMINAIYRLKKELKDILDAIEAMTKHENN